MVTSTVTLHSAVTNRPDEWKIEQGLSAGKLPILDQTREHVEDINPIEWPPLTKDEDKIKAVGDRDKLFTREKEGWQG